MKLYGQPDPADRPHRTCAHLLFFRTEKDRRKQSEQHCSGNAAGSRSQPAGQDAEQTVRVHILPDALCQQIAEAAERDRCAGSRKLDQRRINADRADS